MVDQVEGADRRVGVPETQLSIRLTHGFLCGVRRRRKVRFRQRLRRSSHRAHRGTCDGEAVIVAGQGAIRPAHPALFRGAHEKLAAEGDLLVLQQRDVTSGDTVVAAINRGDAPTVARFPVSQVWRNGAVREAWNDVDVPLTGEVLETNVNGKAARILPCEEMP